MFSSFRWTILAHMSILIISSTLLLHSMWKNWYSSDMEQLMQRNWLERISFVERTNDKEQFFQYLQHIVEANEHDAARLQVFNEEGTVLWEFKQPNYTSEIANGIDNQRVLLMQHEVQHLGETMSIVLEYPIGKDIEAYLQYKDPVVYIFVFIFVAIGMFAGLFLWRSLLTPMERIGNVARKVSQGQYEHRISNERRDELGSITNTFNQMVLSVKEKVNDLTDEKNKLEGVLNNMLSGVILISQKGQIRYTNPSVDRILHLQKNTLTFRKYQDALANYGITTYIEKALEKGEFFKEQLTLKSTALPKIVEVSIVPIRNINRLITSVIVVIHDITELKRLEQVRAEFVANVSHELKTPITSIKGFAETIIDGAIEDKETMLEFTNIIYKESDRLSKLVQDLLDLSKIESTYASLDKQLEDIVELVNEVILSFSNELQKHNQQVSFYSNRDHILHMVNRDLIKQVFINLIANAIAYSKSNSTISIRIYENDNDTMIEVEDTGIGIPKQDLSRIFERFYRVNKDRSRASGGTGLGLSIVKHIVDVHDGTIEVESTVGVGTLFRIVFPKELD